MTIVNDNQKPTSGNSMQFPYRTEPLERARFVERPNRFIVITDRDKERRRTYVANPGKLHEILIPGTTELLLKHKPQTKTKWETLGARWSSRWEGDPERTVFLNTGRVNDVAEAYLREGAIPGLEEATVVRREYTVGDSRFDFLLETKEGELLLEVKSVTLVEENMALFPDARSERATKHVRELTELAKEGTPAAVLFMVQGRAESFLPDLHNDFDFAKALFEAKQWLPIYAVAVPPTVDDEDRIVFPAEAKMLEIPWGRLESVLADSGLYLAVLEVEEPATVEVGALGTFEFPAGFYTYVGSAQRGLSKRMRRHKRKRKRVHWHIDYLRNAASKVRTFAIRGARDESALADEIASLGERHPPGFGATDCDDDGHLVYTPQDPVHTGEFQKVLVRWRHANAFGVRG